METQNFNAKVLSGLVWKFIERIGTQGIQFIIQLILARLLFPEDYGKITLLTIFITLANTIIQGGLNTALIQKKQVDSLDYSSVFYLNLFASVIIYFILFWSAPIISIFFHDEELTLLLRVLALSVFFGSFYSVQQSIVSRNLQFKKLFFSSIGGIVVSGISGISMAYMGFGVWALVFHNLIFQLVNNIILWFTVKWRPILAFSFERVKSLFSFGWKILMSSLLFNLYNDLRTAIIGKFFKAEMLGYYNRGATIPELVVNIINGSIQSVMLPAFSTQQDNITNLKSMMRRTIKISSYVVFPMLAGLAAIAEPLVKLILTEKWLPCVPFIQVFCVSCSLIPIHSSNQQAINALGRSDITLKLNIIKRCVELAILCITLNFGIYAIAYGGIISGFLGSIVNAYPNKKLLNYGYFDQLKDLLPSLILSLVMGLTVYSLNILTMPVLTLIVVQIVLGVSIYLLLSQVFKVESYNYLIGVIKKMIKSKQN